MKVLNLNSYLIIFFTLLINIIQGQDIRYSIDDVKEVYMRQKEKYIPENCRTIHVNIENVITLGDGNVKSSNIDYYSNNNKSIVLTDEVELYQDSTISISVSHYDREIVILNGLNEYGKATNQFISTNMDTTLLNNLEVFETTKDELKDEQWIKMKPNNVEGDFQTIDQYNILVDLERDIIQQIVIIYKENTSDLAQIEYHVHSLEMNKDYEILEKPIKSFILNKQGKIKEAINSYLFLNNSSYTFNQ